jgi:hypothetical protein
MAAHIRRRPILAGIVAVLLVAVLLFGGRSAWRLGTRLLGPPPPPRQTDISLIADWMSVPYISRVYRVPPPQLYEALGVEPEGRQRRPLRDLAREAGRTSDEAVQIVQETVQAWQAEHPDRSVPSGEPTPPVPPLAPPKPDEPGPDGSLGDPPDERRDGAPGERRDGPRPDERKPSGALLPDDVPAGEVTPDSAFAQPDSAADTSADHAPEQLRQTGG